MQRRRLSRQAFLRWSATIGAGLGATTLLAACGAAAPTSGPAATSAPAATTAPAQPTAAAQATAVPTAQAATSAQAITIRYTYDETPGEKTWSDKVKGDYNKLHPEITLQPEPAAESWVEKTVAGLVAGTAPDILMSWIDIFVKFASRGAYADLTETIRGWGASYAYDDIYPTALKDFVVNGKQYSIPYSYDPVTIFFYNQLMFDEAKQPPPNDTWSWDDFVKEAVALTKTDASGKPTQWGFNGAETVTNWGWGRALPAIWSYGGDKYNQDMTKCLLDQPEAMQAIKLFWDLKVNKHASPTPEQAGKLSYYDMLANGQCAMNTTGPWAVTTYREKIKSDSKLYNHWDVGPPPTGPKGRFVWGVPNAWGLNKSGKHVEQSTELLRYLTDKERSKETGSIGRRVPARKSAGDTFLEPNSVPLHQDVFPKSLAYARSAQVHPTKEDQIADVINAGWEEIMLLQKRPPEQVMPEVAAKVNKLLTQA